MTFTTVRKKKEKRLGPSLDILTPYFKFSQFLHPLSKLLLSRYSYSQLISRRKTIEINSHSFVNGWYRLSWGRGRWLHFTSGSGFITRDLSSVLFFGSIIKEVRCVFQHEASSPQGQSPQTSPFPYSFHHFPPGSINSLTPPRFFLSPPPLPAPLHQFP